ncbi:NAD(P)/FAD-dependent oxidoreductase [Gulosibacter molinativorax]|uniref:FAD-dependent oxidoreductase n=1 Tax=Gulosibacter molinativorax TaxID=256821 RepID=A0ABT7C5G7_9MICO|nr:FAD-dependent oxidoreductase [Gulosibacter molinativorax]MDJ1370047.1 FAD-dependent oxidoreductase [Gulosibacter molinativorax]QUY63762.1 D-amino acid dehydrogenase small subunit [Gulosibacter molinativorax]
MRTAIVVGAGIVGLSTAWHLQERGYEVTVVDGKGVAAGSSWGNAGWLTPGKAIPLAHPSLWLSGPQGLLDPDAALHVPLRFDLNLWSFFARFMAHANNRSWDKTMAGLTPIDKIALEHFDEMVDGGVDSWTREGPFVIGFEEEKQAVGFKHEIAGVVRHGQEVPFERLSDPSELAPVLSERVKSVYRLDGQRFLEPGPFTHALGDAVAARGAKMKFGHNVSAVLQGRQPAVLLKNGEQLRADKLVLATGAWLPKLARQFGVRTRVQAGRGYSFSVATEKPQNYPVYLPHARLACTPYQGRFRIAGTMEFRRPDEPLQPRRIQAIVKQASQLFTGVDLSDRKDEWVGSRPVTPDGLPLVGATRAENIFVAGGHGMWGFVLGPATGKLLAEKIDTGRTNPAIAPFDPLR